MAAADGGVPAFEPELPLHCAAASPAADVRAVAQLLAADPGSAAVQDRHGMTPLAWSCARRAPAAVVQCLLDAHPGAAHEHTAGGMLPLHWAAQCKATLEVVTLLLSLRAAHAAERDALGRLPLHAAAGGAGTVAVLDALIEAHPTGGGEEDNLGRRALHHAVGTKAPQESVALQDCKGGQRQGKQPLRPARPAHLRQHVPAQQTAYDTMHTECYLFDTAVSKLCRNVCRVSYPVPSGGIGKPSRRLAWPAARRQRPRTGAAAMTLLYY